MVGTPKNMVRSGAPPGRRLVEAIEDVRPRPRRPACRRARRTVRARGTAEGTSRGGPRAPRPRPTSSAGRRPAASRGCGPRPWAARWCPRCRRSGRRRAGSGTGRSTGPASARPAHQRRRPALRRRRGRRAPASGHARSPTARAGGRPPPRGRSRRPVADGLTGTSTAPTRRTPSSTSTESRAARAHHSTRSPGRHPVSASAAATAAVRRRARPVEHVGRIRSVDEHGRPGAGASGRPHLGQGRAGRSGAARRPTARGDMSALTVGRPQVIVWRS